MSLNSFKTFNLTPNATVKIFDTRDWMLIAVEKKTAGVVVIGDQDNLGPVDQGRGVQLPNAGTVWYQLLGPRSSLYLFAETEESVTLSAVNLPFILGLVNDIIKALSDLATGRPIKLPGC